MPTRTGTIRSIDDSVGATSKRYKAEAHIFHPETIAIVEATRQLLAPRHAALMLRMWYHLRNDHARDLVLLDRFGDGRSLIAAFLDAVATPDAAEHARMRIVRPVGDDHLRILERAFGLAIRDVIGKLGTPMVVRAWCEVLHGYLAHPPGH